MILKNGDCIEEMQKLIDDGVQVDSVVTDPPYHLTSIVDRFGKKGSAKPKDKDGLYNRIDKGFMGQEWDGGDIAFQQETWELAYKLLKPGGHLLAFSASRNYHRMAVAIEDAGFEIRDQMMWLYGSGFPKSMNVGKALDKKLGNERIKTGVMKTHSNKGMKDSEERTAIGAGAFGQEVSEEVTIGNSEWEGWGTALKPAHEPIVMARKPLSEKSIVDNVLKHRTGAINIDECRVEGNDAKYPDTMPDFRDQGKKSKEAIGIDKLPFGQVENAERKDYEMWDIQEESIGYSRFFSLDEWFKKNINQLPEPVQKTFPFLIVPKASKSEKNDGLELMEEKKSGAYVGRGGTQEDPNGMFKDRDSKSRNIHPTVKPLTLMNYLVTLGSRKGDVVLDPFMGSGTTPLACISLERKYIGIDNEEDYYKIAKARVDKLEAPIKAWEKFL